MPKVSVVMPVFNGAQYVGESIESVLAQHNTDLELIVVNDGSTDNSLEIAQAYAAADARVRVISRENSGRPSFPKNDGIGTARGDYVCFLDHDDLYDADRTWQLVEGLDRHPDWVAAFHDLRFIDSLGAAMPGTYLTKASFLNRASPYLQPAENRWLECDDHFYIYQSLMTGAIHTQSVLIALNRLPKGTVTFDTQFTICDDTDLWIRLGLQGKIGYLDKVLSSYRQHAGSITRNKEKYAIDSLKLHLHNFQRVKNKLSALEVDQYRRRISADFASLGYLRYRDYRQVAAREAYRKAMAMRFSYEAAVGYLKTLIPAQTLKTLRSRRDAPRPDAAEQQQGKS